MDQRTKSVKFGIIADLHGGFAKDAAKRLDTFLTAMKPANCDALVQLGDFAFPNSTHQHFADKFNAAHETPIHVIGNHEFDYKLDREDCIKSWGIPSSYYRRDVKTVRVLVLDGNDKGSPDYDGGYPSYIGNKQMDWLEQELAETKKPVMILSHQPLAGVWAIDNAKSIQTLLSKFKEKILICLNGHSHVDSLVTAGGVPYLHINSASYFWVGGKTKTAFYRDALFTTVSINPSNNEIVVSSCASAWKSKSPAEIGYFDQKKNPPPKEIVTPQIRARRVSR